MELIKNRKKCPRSRIEVTPTTLLRYYAHARWTFTYDLDMTFNLGELWS